MALRYAERRKTLDSLVKRAYPTAIQSAQVAFGSSQTESLTFRPGLTVVAGGNGAGKSTVLAALFFCHSLDEVLLKANDVPWLRSLSATGIADGHEWQAGVNFITGDRSGERPFECVYINASSETEMILQQLGGDANVGDLLEGLDPLVLDNEIPQSLGYALRREYSTLQVYEIDAFVETDRDLPIPYFVVESMGTRYSLPKMGRGELCAFYLLWRLERLASGSIVLLEEPESHLTHCISTAALRDG